MYSDYGDKEKMKTNKKMVDALTNKIEILKQMYSNYLLDEERNKN